MIRPVAGRGEEDYQKRGAVDAWSVKDVGEGDIGDEEEGGGVGWDEEEREPAPETEHGDCLKRV